jgi:hypothetical protein
MCTKGRTKKGKRQGGRKEPNEDEQEENRKSAPKAQPYLRIAKESTDVPEIK